MSTTMDNQAWQPIYGGRKYVVRLSEVTAPLALDEAALAFAPYARMGGCARLTLVAKNLIRSYRLETRACGDVRCAADWTIHVTQEPASASLIRAA